MSERGERWLPGVALAMSTPIVAMSAYPGTLAGVAALTAMLWVPGLLMGAWTLAATRGAKDGPGAFRPRRAAAAIPGSSLVLSHVCPRMNRARRDRAGSHAPDLVAEAIPPGASTGAAWQELDRPNYRTVDKQSDAGGGGRWRRGIHDLHATILHLLGFNHTRLAYRHAGRDFRLTDVEGYVVKEILA
jgi:hypothetical protein